MALPNGTNIKIVSLNVNCLSRPASRAGLLDFLKFNKPDLVGLQECNLSTQELSDMLAPISYSCFSNVSPFDNNARGTAFLWKTGLEVSDIKVLEENRMLSLKLGGVIFVNIYGHSGRRMRFERRRLYGETLEQFIRDSRPFLPVFFGDFNCIIQNIDALNNPAQKKCDALSALVRQYVYEDAYRIFYPNHQQFTLIRNNSGSRLDRFYVPSYLSACCSDCRIVPAAFTDHSAVILKLEMYGVQRPSSPNPRSSYWKLNNSVLDHEDFLPNFTDFYLDMQRFIPEYDDIADWWELRLKPMMSQFLKQFSIHCARERRQTKEMLYILLNQALESGVAGYTEGRELKRRIMDMLMVESEGLRIRSRFQENQEKERASLYHLSRERKRGRENNVETLMIGGQEVSDPRLCEEAVLNLFEPLFNGREGRPQPFEIDQRLLPGFLDGRVGKLPDHERDMLDQPFTEDELLLCVQNLPGNKSPGLDGFSNELYKRIYPLIKNDYLNMQNRMLDRGFMNSSMRRGVTRLAPKVSEVPRVDQLRPITVLPVDYGIRNRLYTQRLSPCMENLLKSGQLCSNKKKNILSGVHNIFSTIEYVNMKNMSAALLSFDMSKAFDRCYIPYVAKVMEHMNFSESFIDLVLDMHSGVTTRFILNKLTAPICLTFSIRQGDPIAMLLYIIYMEPFLMKLGQVCSGVRLAGLKQLDEDYADDTEVLVEDDADFQRIDELFIKFERVSGALLSRSEKSKVLGLGGWRDRQVWPLPWLKVVQEIKVFGFQILSNYQDILDRNWSCLIEDIRSTIMSYSLRCLDTLQQRTDVLNIFVFSRLWYKCQALPLPANYASQLERMATRFLWRGKLEKLAMQEVHCKADQGGLGLVEIRSKADALFVKQACRMMANQEGNSVRHIQYWLGLYLGNLMPFLRPGPHSEQIPPFYVHFKRLFQEMVGMELLKIDELEAVKVKDIYKGLTETLPPPKVIFKYNLPWDLVWKYINNPVLDVYQRELLFMLVHNILPTRERLFRLNQADNAVCSEGDGVESVEHLFCTCRRVQVAWAWMRRLILNKNLALPTVSDFELLHSLSGLDDGTCDLVWLISNYVEFVWKQKTSKATYFIDVDILKLYLSDVFQQNQKSQNKVTRNLFT